MTDDLAWFNDLSGKLEITLSEPAQRASPRLLNLAAPKTATLTGVTFRVRIYDRPRGDPRRYDDGPRELTAAEWERIVLTQPTLRLSSEAGSVDHVATAAGFSTRDLVRAIEATERETRGASEWLGGIDVHHVYFEGIHHEPNGSWFIAWGS